MQKDGDWPIQIGLITDELSFALDVSARLEKSSDIPGVELYWPLYMAKPTDPVRFPNGLIKTTWNKIYLTSHQGLPHLHFP